MESLLHSELPYTDMPQMILAQKEELDRRIRDLSTAQIVYPGLDRFQQDGYQSLDVQDIPGICFDFSSNKSSLCLFYLGEAFSLCSTKAEL